MINHHVIAEMRKDKKCTQQEMADYLQMSRATYQKIESGEHEPSLETFVKICDFLGIHPNLLLNMTQISTELAHILCLRITVEGKRITPEQKQQILCFSEWLTSAQGSKRLDMPIY